MTEKKARAKAEGKEMGGELVLVEDFNGELSTLEPGQYAQHPETRSWFFKTPNGLLVELADSRIVKESDGTISVPVAISAEAFDEEVPGELLFWAGTIDHGKWMPNE